MAWSRFDTGGGKRSFSEITTIKAQTRCSKFKTRLLSTVFNNNNFQIYCESSSLLPIFVGLKKATAPTTRTGKRIQNV